LIASLSHSAKNEEKSLIDVTGTGLQVTTALVDGGDLLVRLFNVEGDNKIKKIIIGGNATAAELVELDGRVKEKFKMQKGKLNTVINVAMPRFGLRTLRLKDFTML
jgi:alpha-mannosidase